MKNILILNGPNLNMLGTREPEIYGDQTLEDINVLCQKTGEENGLNVTCKQSNHEGDLVTWIQESMNNSDGLIINAAAYTHTSVAIHDALKMLSCPIIEVHLSDPMSREEFRHNSYISALSKEVIKGQGSDGYRQAIENIQKFL